MAILTLTVNTTVDQNDGNASNGLSLRDAIIIANADPNNDYVINLSGGANYQLTAESPFDHTLGGDLDILPGANVTIVASGQAATIDASSLVNRDRVFDVLVGFQESDGGSLTLNNIIVTGGTSTTQGGGVFFARDTQGLLINTIVTGNLSGVSGNFLEGGGGITNDGGNVVLINSVVTNNEVENRRGGGIFSIGALTLINTTVSNNLGSGVFNALDESTVTLINSAVINNQGRGLTNSSGSMGLNNTTISGNRTGGAGGGILASEGVVNINNSTITGNSALDDFSDPTQGGGIYSDEATINLKNTIVTGNISDENPDVSVFVSVFGRISASINGNANNLIGRIEQEPNGTLGTGTDLINSNAGLGPLQNNGGATLTHTLLDGSPAIDAGNNALVSADSFDLDSDGNTGETTPFDQRGNGYPRIVGNSVDIGAFEYSIDPAQYGASNPDLIPVFGYNLEALRNHYYSNGINEGRSTDSFEPYRYVASNADLITAFGLNTAAATQHYITNGYFEGRPTRSFDPARYLDSYDDLLGAYGTNLVGATQHYITSGYFEGRDPNLFPSDRYIASHGDLIQDFRYNLEAGSNHYLFSGRNEGRQVFFDPQAYLNQHGDLQAAFGIDLTAATAHYIINGFDEGRTWM